MQSRGKTGCKCGLFGCFGWDGAEGAKKDCEIRGWNDARHLACVVIIYVLMYLPDIRKNTRVRVHRVPKRLRDTGIEQCPALSMCHMGRGECRG